MRNRLIALNIILFIALQGISFAEKAMTRAEALALLSKSAQVKKKEAALFNWNVGYDISKINRVRLMPVINFVHAQPTKVPPDGRTILEVIASVTDPGGQKNISGVKADLTSVGKLSNMTLVDNGLYGDSVAGDGVFTLQTTVNPEVTFGDKEIQVTAANKKGWLALAKATIDVQKDPVIVSLSASPNTVHAGSYCYISVRVNNPGRIEDVNDVLINLREVGGDEIRLPFVKEDTFGSNILVGGQVMSGTKRLPVTIKNLAGGETSGIIQLEVTR